MLSAAVLILIVLTLVATIALVARRMVRRTAREYPGWLKQTKPRPVRTIPLSPVRACGGTAINMN